MTLRRSIVAAALLLGAAPAFASTQVPAAGTAPAPQRPAAAAPRVN